MGSKKNQRNNKVKNVNAAAASVTAAAASSSANKAAVAGAQQPATQQQQQQQQLGMFSPGQLASLILLTLGISRLMQIKSALRHEGGSSFVIDQHLENNATSVAERPATAAPICLDYILDLPEIVCVHDVVNTWLNFKYMTGLQVLLTTVGMWLRGGCWFHENLLRAFNALLILTPIVTTAYAFMVQSEGVLNQSRIWQQSLMCIVLSFVASPAPFQIPFINRSTLRRPASASTQRSSYKTVSSLMLMTLFCMQMLQVLAGLGLMESSSSDGNSSWFPQLPSKTGLDTGSDEEKAIARAIWTIHSFWLVDMFTLAAIYFFAWFHLSPGDQKSFLVTVAMVRLMASLTQWPVLMEYQKGTTGGDDGTMVIPVETYQAMDATVMALSVLCYFAPTNLTWKKKLQ